METTNGSVLPSEPLRPTNAGVAFTKEETDHLLRALAEPFDPSLIKWVVKATAEGKEKTRRGLLAAYADPRAYSDRLNELVTPLGWTQEYSMNVVGDFQRKNGGNQTCTAAKVMVICRVTIFGLNSHSGTGEEWADNDNALTSADAQAFKRACSCFGLGRYLYSLPQVWVELDEFKRPVRFPDLPAWALPETRSQNKGRQKNNGVGASAPSSKTEPGKTNGKGPSHGAPAGNGRSEAVHTGSGTNERGTVTAEIQQLSRAVGRKLLLHVLNTSAGVDTVTHVTDLGKLKLILERLQNAQRGTQRLKAVVGKIGLEALRAECEKLKLSGVTTDDIPDIKTLHELIERLEARPATVTGSPAPEALSAGDQHTQQRPARQGTSVPSGIVQLRNELLSRARRLASQRKQSVEAVIAWASDGSLQYAKMSQLGDSDLPRVKAALDRLGDSKA